MSTDRKSIKDQMISGLTAKAGTKLPTSSIGRIGRLGVTVLRSGRMIMKSYNVSAKGEEPEIDMAKVAKVITSVGKLKGVAMKMGQIMSYIDVAMPKELRDALSVLQTHAQPMEWDEVRDLVTEELGDRGDRLLKQMEHKPISSASIGQVHRSSLDNGTVVAVKIQYPQIAKAIAADFGPAAVGTKMASLFYPNARIDDFVKEAKERFLEECDYLHEAHCQNQFVELYATHPLLVVPAVHAEFCSRRVLTTTYAKGLEIDAFLATAPAQEARDRIGKALFEFYIGSLFRHQIYNCDPHPGNYLFLDGGKICMLDHGCTRQFETRFVAKLANLTRAVHIDEREAIHRALLSLKIVREGKKYDYDTIRDFLRGFYGPMLVDDVSRVDLSSAMDMREVMDKKMKLAKFSLPGEFLFLFRIRFGLMSVLSRLGTRANWYRQEKSYIEDFAKAHPILSE
ncbi:MAG: AarF/ABC1/UbiB kinase family protein [Proteobacteria bacterium]|nr:AarF/ABC1/UbiB kinase family protein [Pseudomonadota bacterium]